MDEKLSLKSFLKKTIAIGLLTTFVLAIYNAFIKVSIAYNGFWTTTLWIIIINSLLLIPTIPLFYKDIKRLDHGHILPVGMMGIFETITIFAANKAYGVNLSISTLIMNTPFSMFFAFLFSIFAPKLLEKHSLKIYAIRFTATFIMIYCAMQLTR